uniref:Uncharacterized protein n=1 Tax=Glossina palpalis gambiensis TaxID=67801 RepID=A0A1B0B0C2_9MUSC
MFAVKKNITYFMIFLIVFTCCTQETEGLRRVLRGRRTLTRRYFINGNQLHRQRVEFSYSILWKL